MKKEEAVHLWQGRWINDSQLQLEVENLPHLVVQALSKPLKTDVVLAAAEKVAQQLLDKDSSLKVTLAKILHEGGISKDEDIQTAFVEIAQALSRENLEKKIKRELGTKEPFILSRLTYDDSIFEGRAPLGLLIHISPQNSFGTGPMSVIEGLLTGNVNFLKTGGNESLFSQKLLAAMVESESSGNLKNFIIVGRISSKKKDLLAKIFDVADGVAAWGGEESIKTIREMCPSHVQVVEWGHRISFAYLAQDFFNDLTAQENLAKECCYLEQQACSSPQCLYLETEDWSQVKAFAENFSKVLNRISKTIPRIEPEGSDMAEITQVKECHKLEASFGIAEVIEAKDGEWRVLVDGRESLLASPLYRTLWIKPLPREKISTVLRPMRQYLQTVGLGCHLRDLPSLSQELFISGATRIRRLGEMLSAYSGEPHDGVYALQRYSRKISVQASENAAGISTFEELKKIEPMDLDALPVTPKEAFEAKELNAQLFFKSGGSSGEPKMSTFTYDQYNDQMWLGAEGLYAAGLDPLKDKTINLFFCGGLYGGFISIFSALERLGVKQFPMAANPDLEVVTQIIIKNEINVLLGMPSYILQLFKSNSTLFKKYRRITKIFYGGEHFTESQRKYLMEEFGIKSIRSGAYGSVDIGPMGYQCSACLDGEHHLQQRLQYLEILKLTEDVAVEGEEVGRLVFSPRTLGSGKPLRYAIGDVGHWVNDPGGQCPCGRSAPRFKLLGRTGDIFRIGSMFLNFQKFQTILSEFGYAGDFQIKLLEEGLTEKVTLRITESPGHNPGDIRRQCLENYHDLNEAVEVDHLLLFDIEICQNKDLERSKGSQKLLRVIDARVRGTKS